MYLHFYPIDVRGRQIDLVDNRNYFQIVFHGEIQIGQRLGFDSLTGIDYQQGAFAGGERAGYFIGKIHMSRGVDEIQEVGLPIPGGVRQAHRLAFNGDTPFPLYVHCVENLILEITVRYDVGSLD